MRINPIFNYSTKNNIINRKSITNNRTHEQTGEISYTRCGHLYFGSNIKPEEQRYKRIYDAGFRMYKPVDLINNKGEQIQGYSFVQEKPRLNIIKVLITDEEFKELGHVECSTILNKGPYGGTWCTIVNSTEPNPETEIKPIFNDIVKGTKTGRYKLVGTRAYDMLISYIKENHPEIKELKANIRNQHSWDFHKNYGFTNMQDDEYDMYARINEVKFKIS